MPLRTLPDEMRARLPAVPGVTAVKEDAAPHDLTLEEAVLGAALLRREAAETVAGALAVGQVFYRPAHKLIAGAIAELVAAGSDPDVATVMHLLREQGTLDDVGGGGELVRIMSDCPATTQAPQWMEILQGLYQRRQQQLLGRALSDAAAKGEDTEGLLAELTTVTALTDRRETSWVEVDLGPILDGDVDPIVPAILQRSDGQPLLYPGKIHAVNAEPEAGKSWLAQLASLQQIEHGRANHVLYIDFEADAIDVVGRLVAMGASRDAVLARFHYVRPDDPITTASRLRVQQIMDAYEPTFAVLDGVTEAMVQNGWSIKENDDIARFFTLLPRMLSRTGAAVLLIDHVTKDKESRGRWAIGGQHKLAGVDGAVYALEAAKPFGFGTEGVSKLRVEKDRHAWVRKLVPGVMRPIVAEFRLTSNEDGSETIAELRPPETASDGPFRPTHLMETMSRALEGVSDPLTQNAWLTVTSGNKGARLAAMERLIEEGYVEREQRGQRFLHRSVKPYREDEDVPEIEEEPF